MFREKSPGKTRQIKFRLVREHAQERRASKHVPKDNSKTFRLTRHRSARNPLLQRTLDYTATNKQAASKI